jgi:hypothetical protein
LLFSAPSPGRIPGAEVEVDLSLVQMPATRSECDQLQRLLHRYRDLLAQAQDELLRRGIERQIDSLEQKLRDCDEASEPSPQPVADRRVKRAPLRVS